jgi:hypothetical protein
MATHLPTTSSLSLTCDGEVLTEREPCDPNNTTGKEVKHVSMKHNNTEFSHEASQRDSPQHDNHHNTIFFFKSRPQKARKLNEKSRDSRQLEVVQYERHCAKRHEQAQRSFSRFQK